MTPPPTGSARAQAHADAVPIIAAMKAVPQDRRLDALSTAIAVYCETAGTLEQADIPRSEPRDVELLIQGVGRVYPDRGAWGWACGHSDCSLTGMGYLTRDEAEARVRAHRGDPRYCPYVIAGPGPNETATYGEETSRE